MFTPADLDFWIKNNYNVIFRGKHGVGKTSLIIEAFNKNNLKWQYFSASTMDPWVDFIGVPKEIKDGENSYLELIRPKIMADGTIEALMFDEFNRSSKKVRNAVMELIQFKSVNGKKFPNLKIVWAAINPDDEENTYDVEKLDPAQLDRFHMIVDVPYKPISSYFYKKYGKDLAAPALSWWHDLSKAEKDAVSPRRLDYVLDVFYNKGDIRHVLAKNINVSKLLTELKTGPIAETLKSLMAANDKEKAKEFLVNENNFNASKSYLLDEKYLSFFVPLLEKEKFCLLLSKRNEHLDKHIISNMGLYYETLKQVIDANSTKLTKKVRTAFKAHEKVQKVKERKESLEKLGGLTEKTSVISKVVYQNNGTEYGFIWFNNRRDSINDDKTVAALFKAYGGGKQSNTANKQKLFSAIEPYIAEGMTPSMTENIGIILINIIISSQVATLKSNLYSKIMQYLNYVLYKNYKINNGFSKAINNSLYGGYTSFLVKRQLGVNKYLWATASFGQQEISEIDTLFAQLKPEVGRPAQNTVLMPTCPINLDDEWIDDV